MKTIWRWFMWIIIVIVNWYMVTKHPLETQFLIFIQLVYYSWFYFIYYNLKIEEGEK